MKIDWIKAMTCKHENITDYCVRACGICGGSEYHCKDCGVFFTDCKCGSNSGMSGWPAKKWKAHNEGKINFKKCENDI